MTPGTPSIHLKTAMVDAIEGNSPEDVRRILALGLDPNEPLSVEARLPYSEWPVYPLHKAIQSANPSIVRILIDAGASVRQAMADGDTPLHLALDARNGEIFDMLMKQDVDVNAIGADGDTPICRAAAMEMPNTVKKLLGAGADIHLMNDRLLTPLHRVAKIADWSPGIIDKIARPLIAAGAGVAWMPENPAADYTTPFQRAVEFGAVSFMEFCIKEYGEDPEQTTLDGRTMLEVAKDRKSSVQYLLALRTEREITGAMENGQDSEVVVPLKKPSGMSPL